MSENARHCADPTCHHEKHGYGGCGGRGQTRVVRAVSYEEYQDGCWKVEVKAPGAGWLKGDDGWRARTWWLADAKDRPHICFVGYDFTIAAKVKALAFEVFGKIPGSVPSVAQDEIAALRVRVAELERLVAEKVTP